MCPKSKLPLGSLEATKSISKLLTFYKRGGKQKVRRYNKPSGLPSAEQLTQREVIKSRVEGWQALSASAKAEWNAEAKTLGDPWSGYTLFMQGVDMFTYFDPDKFPSPPSSQDDHFTGDTLDPKWTAWDLGTPKLVTSIISHHISFIHSTEVGEKHRGIYQTLPSGDFTIATKIALTSNHLADCAIELSLFEDAANADGDIILIRLLARTSGNGYRQIYVQRWSDYDSWNANYAGGACFPGNHLYLRIRRDGTTLYYEYSTNGIGWMEIYTQTQPFAPVHMGLTTVNNNSGQDLLGYVDWFRYIASDHKGLLGSVRTVG